jgi:hypothetical protein
VRRLNAGNDHRQGHRLIGARLHRSRIIAAGRNLGPPSDLARQGVAVAALARAVTSEPLERARPVA